MLRKKWVILEIVTTARLWSTHILTVPPVLCIGHKPILTLCSYGKAAGITALYLKFKLHRAGKGYEQVDDTSARAKKRVWTW